MCVCVWRFSVVTGCLLSLFSISCFHSPAVSIFHLFWHPCVFFFFFCLCDLTIFFLTLLCMHLSVCWRWTLFLSQHVISIIGYWISKNVFVLFHTFYSGCQFTFGYLTWNVTSMRHDTWLHVTYVTFKKKHVPIGNKSLMLKKNFNKTFFKVFKLVL